MGFAITLAWDFTIIHAHGTILKEIIELVFLFWVGWKLKRVWI